MIGKFSFLSYKNDDCKGRDVLAVKRGAQVPLAELRSNFFILIILDIIYKY
jgi:hypothetical protein